MMKRFLLLRRNEEFGPYTLDEIKRFRLYPADLIWTDEAQRWMHHSDIEDLCAFVETDEASLSGYHREMPDPSRRLQRVMKSGMTERFPCRQQSAGVVEKKKSVQSLPQFKENYREWRPARKKLRRSFDTISDMTKVAIVFSGVVLGSMVIKKLVDGFDAGASPVKAVATTSPKPVIEGQPSEKLKSKDLVTAVAKSPKNKVDANIKNQVSIRIEALNNSSDAGNSQLKLAVENRSRQDFDKIILTVDFFQANGVLLKSEQLTILSISAHGLKTLSIAGYAPGTTVRYRIVRIDTRQQKARLTQA